MAVEVWSVDSTFVGRYYPTLLISATSKLTPTDVDEIVEGAAAFVNGHVNAAFGAGTVTEIALDTTDLQYRNCQSGTIICAGPALHIAAEGANAADLDDLIKAREDWIDGITRDPARTIGRVQDATMFPGVDTSTKYRNLDTSLTAMRGYRQHDGRNAVRGVDTGGLKY